MSEVKWIKLTPDIFDDEKIKLIESMPDADTLLVIWFKLLCQAGKANAGGYIFLNENIPYTEEQLATIFNRPLNTIRLALKLFEQFNMINLTEDGIFLPKWEKYQNIDGMERLKGQWREASKRHYLKKKEVNLALTDGSHNTSYETHNTDKNRIDENREDKNNSNVILKKEVYGQFSNVLLLPEEYKKLIDKFGDIKTKEWIETLSEGIASKGYKFKSHYATILNWYRRDQKEENNGQSRQNNQRHNPEGIPGNRPAGAFDGITGE